MKLKEQEQKRADFYSQYSKEDLIWLLIKTENDYERIQDEREEWKRKAKYLEKKEEKNIQKELEKELEFLIERK